MSIAVLEGWLKSYWDKWWSPPPCPKCSRLDDWFVRAGHAEQQPPVPVPFFLEVHEEVMKF